MKMIIRKLFSVLLILALLTIPSIIPVASASELTDSTPEFNGYLVLLCDDTELVFPMNADGYSLEKVSDGSGELYFAADAKTVVELAELGVVEHCAPNYYLELYDHYPSTKWNTNVINAQTAWNHVNIIDENDMRGDGITVAVIDTGVYSSHRDFNKSNILEYINLANANVEFDIGHGTAVAGVISAQLNGVDVDGIAPGVSILPICITSGSKTDAGTTVAAIDKAISLGADVINLSLGSTDNNIFFEDAFKRAADAGIIVVAAAGNFGPSERKDSPKYVYPAAYDSVVSVSACTLKDGAVVFDDSYSYYNDQITVSAPGTNIALLSSDGGTLTNSGTSFSSPIVAGMAAMAKQQNKTIDTDIFIELLRESSKDLGTEGYDYYYGYGFVDIEAFSELLTKEYNIIYHLGDVNAGFSGSVTSPSKFTFASNSISLPEPSRNGYNFLGWYQNEQFTGTSIDTLSSGSFGDRDYYALWESTGTTDDPAYPTNIVAISSLIVAGNEAEWNNTNGKYEVMLPKNTVVSVDVIDVIPSNGTTISNLIYVSNGIWSFTATSASGKYSNVLNLAITYSPNAAPRISESAPSVGVAVPASLDGNTSVEPYLADISTWFEDEDSQTLSYHLKSDKGSLSGNILSFTPTAQDANSKVLLSLIAEDEEGLFSKELTISIAVGAVPVSNSVISGSTEYELDPNQLPTGFDVFLLNYEVLLQAFEDITEGAYYYDAVVWAIENGVTNGTSETTFAPETDCTRAQIVVFLWRALGSPEPQSTDNPFIDIADDSYYYNAVLWAFEQGITTGTGDDIFSPNASCTRAQIAVFLWRTLGSPEPESTDNPFIDVPDDSYYFDAILWAYEQKITTGTGPNTFSPEANCTRAQIVTFLYRTLEQNDQSDQDVRDLQNVRSDQDDQDDQDDQHN